MLRIGTMKQLLTTSKIHQSPLLVNLNKLVIIFKLPAVL